MHDSSHPLVFLLDVDNTLLDNDRFADDLRDHLTQEFGADGCERYWRIYEQVRDEKGYADYLETLQRFRPDMQEDPRLLRMSPYLLDYPFAERLYPQALEALAHLASLGLTVILSDGDVVFQPRKIQRSGIWAAVDGRVLVSLHKAHQMQAVQQLYPAHHYVMVDDKPSLLASMKDALGDNITTVFVRQGHYAAESTPSDVSPEPDIVIERIADLRDHGLSTFAAQR